jgi:hypothetical protein
LRLIVLRQSGLTFAGHVFAFDVLSRFNPQLQGCKGKAGRVAFRTPAKHRIQQLLLMRLAKVGDLSSRSSIEKMVVWSQPFFIYTE